KLSDQLGDLLRDIHIPDDILTQLLSSLNSDTAGIEAKRRQEAHVLAQRLNAVRSKMDQMYEDKLDGKIEESFWQRKMQEWREQEQGLENRLNQLREPISAEHAMNAKRVFELANKAYFLYLRQNSTERGELLKSVLLNCSTDGITLTPSYRKP